MKKTLALVLALVMCFSMVACSNASSTPASTPVDAPVVDAPAQSTGPVELNVITSFGGDDGNRKDYELAYKAWEAATGNTVLDGSATYDETMKAKIMTQFETGAEPDVLYYYNGADANKLIEGGKVVSLEEIQAEYPDFGTNMKEDMLSSSCASPVDGKVYALPLIGYWEGLFVNTAVVEAAGATVPDANTTWDEFLDICQKIKDAGYAPIAASLAEIPHYWFEFTVYNHRPDAANATTHVAMPAAKGDATEAVWAAGLNDMKDLYEKGYFLSNTLSCTDGDSFNEFMAGNAAFLIDGSWKIGGIQAQAESIDDFTVTYVPGKENRKSTDVIGGLSMGYYITRQAWENPEKREAVVSFVKVMTSDNVVRSFNQTAINALKSESNFTAPDALTQAALDMTAGATGVAGAAQDMMEQTPRGELFASVKDVVTGGMTAEAAIEAALGLA